MGKICTKCYKTKSINLENCKKTFLIKVQPNKSESNTPTLTPLKCLNSTNLNKINIVKEE